MAGWKQVLTERADLRIIFDHAQSQAKITRSKSETDGLAHNDWDSLIGVARHHGVLPLVYEAVSAVSTSASQGKDRLREHYYSIVLRNQLLCNELSRILGLLEAESIRAISFKGPTLAVLAYGSISMRQFADIDLLVRVEDRETALAILEAEDYAPYFRAYRRPIARLSKAQAASYLRNYHQYELSGTDGKQVDLHWHTAPRRYPFRLDPDRLWADTGRVSLGGHAIATLSMENLILYLCMHGAKERWQKFGWVVDLHRLLESDVDIDWDIVRREARHAHATRVLAFGLTLTRVLLGTRMPPETARGVRWAHELTRDSAHALVFGQKSGGGPWSRLQFELCDTATDRLVYTHRSLTTSGPPDWSRVPLPDSLFWVYPLIKPLLVAARWIFGSRRVQRNRKPG